MKSNSSWILRQIGLLQPDIPFSADRSLLHAYVACLTLAELCAALLINLEKPGSIRSALKARLVRLAQSEFDAHPLVTLVDDALALGAANKKLRPTVDALCAGIID